MRFSIASSWDNKFLEGLKELTKDFNHEYELFGALKQSFLGSGHSAPSVQGNCRTRQEVENYVKKIHKSGFYFNYLINASCLGNKEFNLEDRKTLMENLEWICSFSDAVTVSIPYLIELIKKTFSVEVVVSTIADTSSVKRAKFYEELGADRITLSFMVNRNFKLLNEIRSQIKCKIELMLNDSCLFHCPYRMYHYNLGSHASRLKENFYIDYPVIKCLLERFRNLSEFLRSPWIRPEDLKYYSRYVDCFKIAGREKNADWLLNCTQAYLNEKHQGNLLDLMTMVTPASHEMGKNLFEDIPQIYVENEKLGGFLSGFLKAECLNCENCSYCDEWTKKALTIDEDKRQKTIKQMEKLLAFVLDFDQPQSKKTYDLFQKIYQIYLKNDWQWKVLKPFSFIFKKRIFK